MTNTSSKGVYKTKQERRIKNLTLYFSYNTPTVCYMTPTTLSFKEPHYHVFYNFSAMRYSLRNSASVLVNITSQKPNSAVTAFSTTKIVFISEDKQPITTHNIKNVNASPSHKSISFKILCTSEYYDLESDGVANLMDFVSNEISINMSLAFQ